MITQFNSAKRTIYNWENKVNNNRQQNPSEGTGVSAKIIAAFLIWAILLPVAFPVPALAMSVWSIEVASPDASESTLNTFLPEVENLTKNNSPTATGALTKSPFAVINELLGSNLSGEGENKKGEKENAPKSSEAKKPESKEVLLKRVARIETQLAGEKAVAPGASIQLDALPLDKNDAAVDGVAPEWKSSNSKVVVVQNNQLAVALSEGTATLTAKAGAAEETITVIVKGDETLSNAPAETKSIVSNSKAPVNARIQTSSTPAPENGTPPYRKLNSGTQPQLIISPTPPPDCPPDCEEPPPPVLYWSPEVWSSLFRPNNNLGSPSGQTEPSVAPGAAARTRDRGGIGNFSFGVPVASIPGRGIDGSVGIIYNSQLWNKSTVGAGDVYTYDVNNDWLAPGFDLSLGTLDALRSGGSVQDRRYSVTAPDGTRHELVYKEAIRYGVQSYYWESTDSSFYRLLAQEGTYDEPLWVKDDQGNLTMYGSMAADGRRYTAQIIDRNGNYLSIAYLAGNHKGRIAYIRDTLNRYIRFHYDDNPDVSKKKLITVTVPGFNGPANTPESDPSVERQTIRFYYETMNLTAQTTSRFSGTISSPPTIDVLRFVYMPSANMGYRYDYSLTHGTTLNTTPVDTAFGMIYKITQLRGMQVSTTSTSEIGTITNYGQEAAWTEYDYLRPLNTGNAPLSDVPKYTERTDDWVGRSNSSAPTAPKYIYNEMAGTRDGDPVKILKVTSPDGTVNETVSRNLPPAQADLWNNGLILETSVTNSSGQLMSKSVMTWVEGNDTLGRRSPRISKVDVTNEAGLTRATVISYDRFNNPTVVRECDFGQTCDAAGTELRRTETSYENAVDSGWEEVGLLRLPKEIKVYAKEQGVEKLASRVKYEYDAGEADALLVRGAAGTVPQHRNESNPSWDPNIYIGSVTVLRYFAQVDFRGNVTKVESFADPANDNDPNRSITKMWYDMLGNAIKAEVNCCQLKTWEYASVNHYAYPLSETRGPEPNQGETDIRLTTSAEYNFYTGLVQKTFGENNQQTQYIYEPNTLRLQQVNLPNGGQTTVEYHDEQAPSYIKTTTKIDATRTVSAWQWADGRGAVYRTRTQTPEGFVSSDVEFDNMGRARKTYNPYVVANFNASKTTDTLKWSEVTGYDAFGRALSVKLTDNAVVQNEFSRTPVTFSDPENAQGQITGMAVTVTDQVGKKRRTISDVFGRTVRADEPNATGSLDATDALKTYYWYDANDNLRKTSQTGDGATQERLFKYDGLSRLINEKQVEANATLDNNGVVVGNGTWTGYYKYNPFGLLEKGVDARGVTTTFGYDGLNRIQTVTYSGESGLTTPSVTYNYGNDATQFNKGRLTSVVTSAIGDTPSTAQSYEYNPVGQIKKQTETIGTSSYVMEYDYYLAGGLKWQKYPSGREVTYSVDNAGRLSGIADTQRTYASNFQFENGLLKGMTLGNGTTESYKYNDRLQLESQTLVKNNTVQQKLVYGYGEINPSTGLLANNGKVSKVENYVGGDTTTPFKQQEQQFVYDSIGRLKQSVEKRGDTGAQVYQQTYSYDRFGNRYQKAADNQNSGISYQAVEDTDIDKARNRFTFPTITYDNAGNITTDNKFRYQQSYWYDANGRMIKAQTQLNNTVYQSDSVYDALGQRVAAKVNGIWQHFVYDISGQMVAEYGTESEGKGAVNYIHKDNQGSTRVTTNASGWVSSRSDYTAFGDEIITGVGQGRSAQAGYNTKSIRQKYALTERDDFTSLDHTPWRKLNSSSGRWTSPDPYKGSMSLNDPQSFNRYSYVNNDPVNFVDPSGLNDNPIIIYQNIPPPDNYTYLWLLSRWLSDPSVSYTSGTEVGGSPGTPPDEPQKSDSCTITITVNGSMNENVSSVIPPHRQFGPKDRFNNEERPGVFFTFQVEASVSGNAGEWNITQQVHDTLTFERPGYIHNSKPQLNRDDAPNRPGSVWRGNGKIIWIDSPGIENRFLDIQNGMLAMNGISKVQKGNVRCSMKWSLIQIVKNGKVVKNNFFINRYLTSNDYAR
jgi:RHS repeat-associated protein